MSRCPHACESHYSSEDVKLLQDISTIDAELHRLMEVPMALRRRRNALIPIARLPDDLLTRVFRTCMPRGYFWRPPSRQQLVFTHVCSHWRSVGLQDPVLWASLNLNHGAVAQEFLSRSGQAPLFLYVEIHEGSGDFTAPYDPLIDARWLDDIIGIIYLHASRIRGIRIHGSNRDWRVIEDTLTRNEARFPGLQYIDASVYHPWDAAPGASSNPGLSWATDASLHHLHLRDCRFDLAPFDPSCIRSLHLHNSQAHTIDAAQWHYMLSSATRLESLHIADRVAMPTMDGESLVELPHLVDIRLEGPMTSCANILDHVQLPAAARIAIHQNGPRTIDHANEGGIEALASFLARYLARIPTSEVVAF
jgi:hypothetical protein